MVERYDVALSFTGKDRPIARAIAEALSKRGLHVFFDEYYQAELARPNLYEYLRKVYEEAQLCVVILSDNYADDAWAQTELRNLLAHAKNRDTYTIMLVGTNLTRFPNLLDSPFGYLDYSKSTPEHIAELTEKRLQLLPSRQPDREPKYIHVIPRDSGWSVKRQASSRAASIHSTQEEAIEAARALAARNSPSEVIIHRKDGSIEAREGMSEK